MLSAYYRTIYNLILDNKYKMRFKDKKKFFSYIGLLNSRMLTPGMVFFTSIVLSEKAVNEF
jgi:hypothetical protein